MPSSPPSPAPRSRDELWGLSCYFNPCRYRQRLANHRRFREALGLPLLTVELATTGGFELGEHDADRLVRLRADDVLWQKERLLNLGLAALPRTCTKVAWLDCDVLFGRDDWREETTRRLDEHVLVQPFHRFTDLPRGARDVPGEPLPATGHAFAWLYEQGGHEAELFEAMWGSDVVRDADGTTRVRRRLSSGFAWAGRREVLQRHGLYDACILGAGDRAIACAAYGRAATSTLNFLRSDAQRRHYLAWAEPFAREVRGRVACVEGDVYHLWHGELKDRRYRERWRELAAFGFDPFTDLATDEQGCWRWASDKPEMHAYVQRYFEGRREDGPGAGT